MSPGPRERPLLAGTQTLKVVSYNILAPRYANYNSYCPPQFLSWEYRQWLVLRELEHHDADVVALQECDQAFFQGPLQGWMTAMGMEGEFLPRQVGPVPGPTEGIALLWRGGALQRVEVQGAEYRSMAPGDIGLEVQVAGSSVWVNMAQRGEGVLAAALRHTASGKLLVAAVTHLFWDPTYPDVKALQAALMCAFLARFSAKVGRHEQQQQQQQQQQGEGSGQATPVPLVLGGDFNSLALKLVPDKFDPQVPEGGLVSGVYELLSRGVLPPEHQDHPARRAQQSAEGPAARTQRGGQRDSTFPEVPLTASGLELQSVNATAFGREPPLTTRTATWAGCIDFVWVTRGSFAVASALALPYSDGGRPPVGPGPGAAAGGAAWCDPLKDIEFEAIPDQRYPSDHLAVGGQVVLL